MTLVDYKGKLIFKIDNKDFRAGGFLIHRNYNNERQIMMIKSKRGYEFPGGKVDERDNTLFDTAIRELVEETNGCINSKLNEKFTKSEVFDNFKFQNNPELKEELSKYLDESRHLINEMFQCCDYFVDWIPDYKFKYGLFFTQLPESWLHSEEIYGEVELWENVSRKVVWVSCEQLLNIILDNSIQKFSMLTQNTFLKNKLIKWLESNGQNNKVLHKFMIREYSD